MTHTPSVQGQVDIRSLEKRGWAELESQNYAAAQRTFSKILEIDPGNEAAFQGKAAALRKQRLFPLAEKEIAAGLAFNRQSVGIRAEKAWLFLEWKKYPEAIEALDQILEIQQEDLSLYLWKSTLLRQVRRLDQVEELLQYLEHRFVGELALSIERGWLYFDKGMYVEARHAFDRVLQSDPQHEVALQGKIAALRKQALFQEAEQWIETALGVHPRSVAILNEKGWLYFEQGYYQEAGASFDQVCQLTPQDPAGYVNQAWVRINQKGLQELTEASHLCRQALLLDSTFSTAFSALGVVAFKQDKSQEAEAYFQHAISLDPVKGPYADLGALYIRLERYTEAEQALDQALQIQPKEAYNHLQKGTLFLHNERLKDAVREFRIAVSLAPRHPAPLRALAIGLMETCEFSEAERVLRRALHQTQAAQRLELHLALTHLFLKLGDTSGDGKFYEQALIELKKANPSPSFDPTWTFYNGLARFKMGDYPGALRSFQECLLDEHYGFEADLNSKRLQTLIQQQKAMARVSLPERVWLSGIVLTQLVSLWVFYLVYHQISETVMLVLVPILLGLLVVAVLLPYLTRLKITGIEAELSEPTPKNSLVTGPQGEVSFRSLTAVL